ncbi:COG0553: Superfamily II DNA/RNA helicases, SNF2 family [hydrothermal vent metagenome]|uniref:COG0553: Superfamily II DNA/RNA helicases, SNF2 family n=1 Tax=hydrothermal vent metagenome TaxID=652676 RepID=A0A1W1EH61_9ZZZZ
MRFFNFGVDDIKANFSEDIFIEGEKLFAQNSVLEYDSLGVSRKEIKILSVVEDTQDDTPYEQEVNIYRNNDKIIIDGGCSCETCINCKHIVAVIMQHINDKNEAIATASNISIEIKNDPTININNWVERLILSSEQKIKNDNELFLAYKIVRSSNPNRDDIKCYKTKIIKNGSLGKGTSVDIRSLAYNNYDYSFLTNDDIDILKILNSIAPKHQDTLKLKGKLGRKLLEYMVSTNRCYLDGGEVPLKISKEKEELSFKWKSVDDNNTILISSITDEFILYTTPISLIKSNTIFELSLDYSNSFLRDILTSPKIPNSFLDEVVSKIDTKLPHLDIEPPSHYEIKILEVEPTPRLYITTDEIDGKIEHILQLSFEYEDNKIPYKPLVENKKILKDGYALNIIRDFDSENSSIDELKKIGFSPYYESKNITLSTTQHNMIISLDIWREFLEIGVKILQQKGWIVEFDKEFTLIFEEPDRVVADINNSNNSWLELSFNIEIGDKKIPILSIITSLIRQVNDITKLPKYINIEIAPNHFIKIETSRIEPMLKTIFNLFDTIKDSKKESIEIEQYNMHLIEPFKDSSVEWSGNRELLGLSKRLTNFDGIEEIEAPKNLNASLRDYQQKGLEWLNFLYEYNFSGILADDMGLGKTLQVLSHLQNLKERGKLTKPSLIVMPTSLIGNWKSETKKFTPDLKVLSLYGSNRFELLDEIDEYDIILTTYQLASKDEKIFETIDFLYVILDEAQKIKNPRTKMAIAIKSFNSDYRIAMSGTPIENHLGELWSIFSFLMPGFLSTLTMFKRFYQNPIEKDNLTSRQDILNRKIKPFMLRRTKDSVIDELPDKTEIIKYVEFDEKQSQLYESIRVSMEKEVRELVSKQGLESSHITILDALLKLRQVCCHPKLLKLKQQIDVEVSAKLELFLELIEELLEEGRKILVFSQFTSMLKIIESALIERKVRYSKLVGSTKNRDKVIDDFRSGRSDIFLISLKAGGVGLNLVEADTVIHYDPWWNPATENQATDRAYRIGQTKAVFVYKLIVQNSIEEKIIELQKSKKRLQDNLYDNSNDEKFSSADLLDLLK